MDLSYLPVNGRQQADTRARNNDHSQWILTTCGDRIISTLDELDLMKQPHEAEQLGVSQEVEEKLLRLGRSLFYLKQVQKAAKIHANLLTFVDEIEVFLAF